MKRCFTASAVSLLVILFFVQLAHTQGDSDVLSKKQAQAEVAADSDQYVIGAEDVLYIHVWKEETLSKTVTVRMDGKISLPLIDEVRAAGLTPLKLKGVLIEKLKEFIGLPNVSVVVMEANSFKIYISGQVRGPGVHRLRSETSILQAIAMVGGFTDLADQKRIVIVRKEGGEERRIIVNYKKIVDEGNTNENLGLKPGDTIIVPLASPRVDKEVLAKIESRAEVAADSDQYQIGPEDVLYIHVWKEDTLSKTVTVRMDGKISMPLIDEVRAAGLTPLKLKDVLAERLKEFVDLPNISVVVMEANSCKAYISGQVKTPGILRIRSETTLAQAIAMSGGFTEWADQKRIIVIRKEDGKEKRFTVNYKKIIKGDDLNSNVVLKSGDTIIVP